VRPGSGNPGVLLCCLGGRRDGRSGGGRGRYRSADRYPARTRDTLFCLSRSGRDHDAEMTPVWQHGPAAPGHRPARPRTRRWPPRRRRPRSRMDLPEPVLGGLINEYSRAAW